ncbi:hypothetical protein TB1_001122 [Malus domestica]
MLLQREQEDEAPLLPSEDEEEEEKSEYDTESEQELNVMLMLKPLFVPKLGRHTIAERVQLEAEEWALEESRKKKLEERKRKTKQIVVEEIWKDKGLDQEAHIVADIDTDDDVNEAEEYEAWKTGEIVRIKSDREGWEAMLKEEDETEKVRNMTEEERSEWERTNLKPAPQPKQKWMFMQKYHHKGAFFQSEADGYATRAGTDGIYARHYSAPIGEAKMDITNCPNKYYHKAAFFQSEADVSATKAGTDGIYARHYSAPTGEAKMDITNCPRSLNTVNVENHKG